MSQLGKLIAALGLSALAQSSIADSSFNGENALQHIANQIAYGPRSPDNLLGKQQTLNYIKEALVPLTDSLVVQPFHYRKIHGNNLWATVQGTGEQATLNAL